MTSQSELLNKTVYQVFEGEAYEGGQTQGIFISYENALLCAEQLMKMNNNRRKPWTKDPNEDTWNSGCNYIEIIPYKLNDDEWFTSFANPTVL